MKNNKRWIALILPLLLMGCGGPLFSESSKQSESQAPSLSSLPEQSSSVSEANSFESIASSEERSVVALSSSEEGSSEEPLSVSEETFSSSEEESSVFESEGTSSIESSSDRDRPVNETYHFYCVNDFHGSIVEQTNGYNYESGIAKYFGALKAMKEKDPEHTILLSAGDMFQGSMESNSNYGMLVTEAMNAVRFDAMCLGNHEFDYGQGHLLDIVEEAEFPILGGNIVLYENGAPTTTPWNENVRASTVIERGNARIGIVGMIGEGQTESITSQFVADIHFASPEKYATKEATRLREEEDCDLVFLLIHDTYQNATFAADMSLFNGVFTAHNHRKEEYKIGGVPFVESYCNGQAYSSIDITFDDGVPSCSFYRCVNASKYWEEDETIAAIRDSYIKDESFVEKASSRAGYINGTLGKGEGVPNITCKAMYEKYGETYPDLCCAMMNSQRASLTGEVTYRDIYKAAPFTDYIVIASVKGSDIINEAYYNCTYTEDLINYSSLDPNEFYTIACVDYVLYHQDVNKVYNYFPSLNEGKGGRIIAEHHDYPFDLIYDYMKNALGGEINANDFLNSSKGFGLYA